MDHGPLVTEEIEAGERFIREFDHFAPVKVAFWLREFDDDHRYLYLASDQLDDATLKPGYEEVLRISKRIPSLYLNPFRVNLIASTDRLALAASAINQQFPNPLGSRLGTQPFGEIFLADGYIYPSKVPVGVL